MKLRGLALLIGAVVVFGVPVAAGAQTYTAPDATHTHSQVDIAPIATPEVQVAGVQTSAEDARLAGENEEFIVNDGFGD